MSYIYHRVPNNQESDVLYPLNLLEDIYPDIYRREFSKYTGREHIPKQRIPLFENALWNDVIFLIATNPNDIYEARRQAGWPDLKPQRYYKIDPRELDQSKLGVFLFNPTADPTNYTINDFRPYNYDELHRYAKVPESTKEYFKQEYEAGSSHIKLFFRYIPHILYHGEINVSNTEIITVV